MEILDLGAATGSDRQLRNLHALLDLSRTMARQIHVDDLLRVIVDKTTDILEADRSSLFLYDERREELWSRVAQGLEVKEIRFPRSRGIIGHVATTASVLNIPDAYKDDRFDRAVDVQTAYRTRSILCMPVLDSADRLLGVLEVLNKRSGERFDEDDEALLQALCAHVSVALERARMVEAYAEQRRLEETLQVAQNIQMSMLPKGFASAAVALRADVHARMVPAMHVGGDFYDYFEIDDERIGFSVGDVSGKGVPAALFMAVCRSVLKAVALTGIAPAACLQRTNALLFPDRPASLFVTVCYGILNLGSGEVEYSIGGHHPPLHVTKSGTVSPVDRGRSIGLCLRRDFAFPTGRLVLEPGDGLVLFTDGVTEAMSPEREMFGDEGLALALRRSAGQSASDMIDGLYGEIEDFTQSGEPWDDLTTLAVRFLG